MSSKIITYDELKAHSTKDNIYLLIHGKGASLLSNQLAFARLY